MVTKCDSIWVWVVVAVGLIACQPQSDRHLQDASRPQNQTTTHKTVAASPTDQQENHISVVLEWEHLQPQTITAPDDGKLEQLLVQNGQQIVAGQLLAQFKPSQHRNTTKHTSIAQKHPEKNRTVLPCGLLCSQLHPNKYTRSK